MQSEGLFFIGVLVFFFILWVVGGGPSRPISFAGPYITPITNVGQTQNGYGPNVAVGGTLSLGGGSVSAGERSGTGSGSAAGTSLNGVSAGNTSVYAGTVTLQHYVNGTNSTDPAQEYLELDLSSNATKDVDITGWKVMSTVTDLSATIPKGSSVLRSGQVNTLGDIVLTPGDYALITTGPSPVGASFAQNECTGYLSQYQRFYPSLSGSCPSPLDDLHQFAAPGLSNSQNSCYSYVSGLGWCSAPTSTVNVPSGACEAFVSKYINYNGCVDAHGDDVNFLTGEWRIYLGRTSRLWKNQHDTIELIDAGGKVVDEFSN